MDEIVGLRFCLKCGAIYEGKHSDCPHKNVKGFNSDLASVLSVGLNER